MLKDFPTPGNNPLPAGEPIELELRGMGSTLIAKINGTEVGRVEDNTLKEGQLAIRLESGVVLYAVEILDLSKEAAPVPAATVPATATKDAPYVNTLGMRFVPVPITGGPTAGQGELAPGHQPPLVPGAATSVLFSVWDTRVQDYAEFVKETKREWPKPEFQQGPTHPAVMVSWDDATAFCAWLTERERKAGKLGANERYRLPSDHEWSCAVGLARGGRGRTAVREITGD